MDKEIKRLGIFHSKDMDGFFSGAVLKYRFPDITLMGWDYSDQIPDMSVLDKYDEVIMIDVTFPLEFLIKLSQKTRLKVIDHHISFSRQVDEWKEVPYSSNVMSYRSLPFVYIYDSTLSACEIGFNHYFGHIPPIVSLVGDYDTWRSHGTSKWEEMVTPMKYYLYGRVSKPTDVKSKWLDMDINSNTYDEMSNDIMIYDMIDHGKTIRDYTTKMNEVKTESFSHENDAYGLKALCLNTNTFSSEVMMSRFDPQKHDLMVGYCYTGNKWSVSLRSIKGGVDVSEIAKKRGGGGHMCASGFEVDKFEDVFK